MTQEVIALQELVGELGEAQAVAGGAVEALLHTVLGHHIVHGDVLAHLARKIEESEVLHPVIVIHHLGGVRLLRLEIKEFGHLVLDAFLVVAQSLFVEQVTFLALARWVTNHTRCTAYKNDGLVTAALQVAEHHDAAKVSDM